jgi:hypothetical protein
MAGSFGVNAKWLAIVKARAAANGVPCDVKARRLCKTHCLEFKVRGGKTSGKVDKNHKWKCSHAGQSTKLVAVTWNVSNSHSYANCSLLAEVDGGKDRAAVQAVFGPILDQAQQMEQDGINWNFTINALTVLISEVLLQSGQFLDARDRAHLASVSTWFVGIDREVAHLDELEAVAGGSLEDVINPVQEDPFWSASTRTVNRNLEQPKPSTRKSKRNPKPKAKPSLADLLDTREFVCDLEDCFQEFASRNQLFSHIHSAHDPPHPPEGCKFCVKPS